MHIMAIPMADTLTANMIIRVIHMRGTTKRTNLLIMTTLTTIIHTMITPITTTLATILPKSTIIRLALTPIWIIYTITSL